MRSPGEILLISCYELGHQPLSLASPTAFLTRAGYWPATVDTSVDRLSDAAIAQARFVGISVPMHTALRLGVQAAERVRSVNPSAHVCLYGHYAVLNAEFLLRRHADSVVGGEYEGPLVALIAALEAGAPLPVDGVRTRDGDGRPLLKRLPFPVPERGRLPSLDRYARLEQDGELKLAGYVEASRGCLHVCRHCPITPIYQGRFFVMPAEVVLEDIRQQVRAGAEHITFGDPDFLNGPGHVLKIVREMHAEFPALTFDATIKIEHILEHRALFAELASLGCAFVVSAVESVSDVVLARLGKGHTRADVETALEVLDRAGIPLRPSLMPLSPWETIEGYLDLLAFVEAHDLIGQIAPVQYSIRLLIPPGSAILELPDVGGWLGELGAPAFRYRWKHPDPRLDRLHAEVSARVEASELAGEDPHETFAAIKELAYRAAGRAPVLSLAGSTRARRPPAPRLTESWFC